MEKIKKKSLRKCEKNTQICQGWVQGDATASVREIKPMHASDVFYHR